MPLPFPERAGFGLDGLGDVCLGVAGGGDPVTPDLHRERSVLTGLYKLLCYTDLEILKLKSQSHF